MLYYILNRYDLMLPSPIPSLTPQHLEPILWRLPGSVDPVHRTAQTKIWRLIMYPMNIHEHRSHTWFMMTCTNYETYSPRT